MTIGVALLPTTTETLMWVLLPLLLAGLVGGFAVYRARVQARRIVARGKEDAARDTEAAQKDAAAKTARSRVGCQ